MTAQGRQYRVLTVMAKVMVSLPYDLLGSLDAEAARRRTTRSGLLRHYVDEACVIVGTPGRAV